MPIIYKSCDEDGTIPQYICNNCGEGENGRVSGVFFAHKDLLPEITQENLTKTEWWEEKIVAGSVFVIPNVRGTYDGGTINTVTGFGRQAERVTGKTHTVVFNDKNHKGNNKFYAAIEKNSKDYVFGFVTENELRPAAKALNSFEAKDPVEEDLTTKVTWQNTATWIQDNPMIIDIIDISESEDIKKMFDSCIEVTTL